MWGFADLHAHLIAHLAFGGNAFWGQPYDPEHPGPEGVQYALPRCDPIHGGLINVNPEFGHPAGGGWPDFIVWPRFTTLVHQLAYVDWLYRAYTKHGHKLRFCFEQKAAIMGILTSMPIAKELPMIQIEFTKEEIKTLNYERYHHPQPSVQRKREVLWLKAHGLAHDEITQLANVSPNTLRSYFRDYAEGGIEKLKEVNFYQPQSDLVAHQDTLEEHFRQNLPATIKATAHEIEALTGITRSEIQVRAFIIAMGKVPQSRLGSLQGRPRRTSGIQGREIGVSSGRSSSWSAGRFLCGCGPFCLGALSGLFVVFHDSLLTLNFQAFEKAQIMAL